MIRRLWMTGLLGVSLAGLAVGQPPDDPPPPVENEPKAKTDLELLQGTWEIVGLEANGKPEPVRNFQGNLITITRDKLTLRERGYAPLEFGVTLDTDRTPKGIDLTGKNIIIRGIYRLEGDDLTLTLGIGGGRPSEFVTRPGGESETFRLRRSNWVRLSDPVWGLAVELPPDPERRTRPGPMPSAVLVARAEPGATTYVVTVTAAGGMSSPKELAARQEAAAKAAVAEVEPAATVTTETETVFKAGGLGGREFKLTLTPPGGSGDGSERSATARVRVVIAAERIYALAVVGSDDEVRAPSVGRFWASFRVLTDRKN